MRYIYTAFFYLITPLILLRLYWRGYKALKYRKRWKERLAIYSQNHSSDVIWIHAVSVGEVVAVSPLIHLLQTQYPEDYFIVTTTTPTGSERVDAELGKTVDHVYLPYDLPNVVKRFLTVFRPKVAIFMEKEIWPNIYQQCFQRNIPLVIINARLSESSAKNYKKILRLVKPALINVTQIAVQTEEDKQRFISIGAKESRIKVTGNLKFDIDIAENIILQAQAIKADLFACRFVWIIASTHNDEEIIFFELYFKLKKQIPELLLLVVPRHPERFEYVKKLAEKMRLKTCMRSKVQSCAADVDVYIADTMGELKLLFGTADISFVGGSMVPIGGHNILEPAAMNVPITFGPYMDNFKEIAKNVIAQGAAIQCKNKIDIMEATVRLYKNVEDRKRMVSKMYQFLNNNQGATEKVGRLISNIIER